MRRALIAAVVAASCSHTQPREMTVDEHRVEARAHEAAARREEAQYQPGLVAFRPLPHATGVEMGTEGPTYNPTRARLEAADLELRRAAEHAAAAKALEQFQSEACRDIPPPERAACPLLATWVSQVRYTRSGVELTLRPEADAADTLRRLACHLAHAEATGFSQPSCPLFVRGLSLELRAGGVLAFSGSTPDVSRALQLETSRLFGPREDGQRAEGTP